MGKAAEKPSCTIRMLPGPLLLEAARIATAVYAGNPPPIQMFAASVPGDESDMIYFPGRIAALTDRYWGPKPRTIPVQFLDNPTPTFRRMFFEHANAWDCGITFVEAARDGRVRLSRADGGYASFIGTDILLVRDGPTMWLQGFTERTSAAEWSRVVPHEIGHTLGFPHEHMRKDLLDRLDREKTYVYYARVYGFSRRDTEIQVFSSLEEASIMGTPPDQTSIMCYQFPGELTKDGRPIPGGLRLNESDLAFADAIYPLSDSPAPPTPPEPPVEPPVEPPTPPVEPAKPPAKAIPLRIGVPSGPHTYKPASGPVLFAFDVKAPRAFTVRVRAVGRWILNLAPGDPSAGSDVETKEITDHLEPGTYYLQVSRAVRNWSGPFRVAIERAK
jgi:hypothetical protein